MLNRNFAASLLLTRRSKEISIISLIVWIENWSSIRTIQQLVVSTCDFGKLICRRISLIPINTFDLILLKNKTSIEYLIFTTFAKKTVRVISII